ncbi:MULTISPECIES: SCO3374 family protein [unclassified Streptomyces]|uniref:SCO3374 family protein n=1 Tax=unclassified Streptomyces TaxID=2593676 RepID=UPI0033CBFA81
MALTVPSPELSAPTGQVPPPRAPLGLPAAQWYERELGWAVVAGPPVRLLTGLRFDVLDVPAAAGAALLARFARTGPVALAGRRMRFLVAAGSAEELPGLLDWLEWGGVGLDLSAVGAGGRITAPPPPGRSVPAARDGSRETAVWLRPPEPGCEVEATLPAFAGLAGPRGGGGGADTPDLVRLVDAAATACHRARLFPAHAVTGSAPAPYRAEAKWPGDAGTSGDAGTQPFAFS